MKLYIVEDSIVLMSDSGDSRTRLKKGDKVKIDVSETWIKCFCSKNHDFDITLPQFHIMKEFGIIMDFDKLSQ